jgi:hypothetical protein
VIADGSGCEQLDPSVYLSVCIPHLALLISNMNCKFFPFGSYLKPTFVRDVS